MVRGAAKLATRVNRGDPTQCNPGRRWITDEPPMNHGSDLLRTAIDAAEAAAVVHADFLGQVRTEDAVEKGTSDFVSHVDFAAQKAALAVIRRRFPTDRILSEEEEECPVASETILTDPAIPLWIVDPLDGTTNYLHGHPAFASSVGVVIEGEAVAGAVVATATGERWWAVRGEGAFRDGVPIHVSRVHELRLSLIGTGFPFKHMDELPSYLRELESVLPACSGIRRGGSAALDLCYLAQGSLDAFWESRLDPWDVAAGLVILREAGGVFTRKGGRHWRSSSLGPCWPQTRWSYLRAYPTVSKSREGIPDETAAPPGESGRGPSSSSYAHGR